MERKLLADASMTDLIATLGKLGCFGIVLWSNDDIESALEEEGVEVTDDNVKKVRDSYYARHIDEVMIEAGWGSLYEAARELKGEPKGGA